MSGTLMTLLRQLARLYGVQTAYYDVTHRRRQASAESLLAALQTLGAPVEGLKDVPAALRERRQALWQRPLEPVTVVWGGAPLATELRIPDSLDEVPLAAHITEESGQRHRWEFPPGELPVVDAMEVEGTRYVLRRLSVPGRLPPGLHRLCLEIPGMPAEALIVAAPLKAYSPPDGARPTWGVFLPLYALYTRRSWGSGDLTDLGALMEWVSGLGGDVVATLPLLATFLDQPFEPSPYAPVSRLMWSEFYVDVTRVPELHNSPRAQARLESLWFQEELRALRSSPVVDYRRSMAVKRTVLEELCQCCFAEPSDRRHDLERFAGAQPEAEGYARFRAACEQQHTTWRAWPEPLRGGILKAGDYDEGARRYHLYVQWLAHQQVQSLSQGAHKQGSDLYLDLPLGCHPDGYDVWRWQDLFVRGASAGAPPDPVFSKGQDWGFPPLHPERLRHQGYAYYVDCLRHHLRQAGILRIDHVMGFHRLFFIPQGLGAGEGVYVRYRPEEFYAILALESHRHRAMIVGEDLGTVPPEVRPSMARHGLHRTHVVQYELTPNPSKPLPAISADMVASLNTHDMPCFAAFWRGLDVLWRQEMGLLDESGAQQELACRRALKEALVSFLQSQGWAAPGPSAAPEAVLKAVSAFLSASPARVALVNLEDLWLETRPQNIPGTSEGQPNWRRRAHYSLEAFSQLPQAVEMLRDIDRIRQRRKSTP